MIDKNIHFIWMQGWDEFPEKYQSNVQSVIDKNPTWKVYKWDDTNIKTALKDLGQQYLDKYNGFKYLHQKVDFSRYALLYKYGGVSVDTDVVGVKGFDQIPNIDNESFIVSEMPHVKKRMNNATIFTAKNSPILKNLIDNIPTDPCKAGEPKYLCIQRTTGPSTFNNLLKPYKSQITVLDKSFLEPCSSLNEFCDINPNTVLDHRHELSSLQPWQKKLGKLYWDALHYKYQILGGLILIIALIFLLKPKRSNS